MRRRRPKDLERRLDELEAKLPPPEWHQRTDQELIACLKELAEKLRERIAAMSNALAEPGSDKLSDAEVARRCGQGVTAEMVHLQRHPPPPVERTAEELAKLDRVRGVMKELAAIDERRRAEAAGNYEWSAQGGWRNAMQQAENKETVPPVSLPEPQPVAPALPVPIPEEIDADGLTASKRLMMRRMYEANVSVLMLAETYGVSEEVTKRVCGIVPVPFWRP